MDNFVCQVIPSSLIVKTWTVEHMMQSPLLANFCWLFCLSCDIHEVVQVTIKLIMMFEVYVTDVTLKSNCSCFMYIYVMNRLKAKQMALRVISMTSKWNYRWSWSSWQGSDRSRHFTCGYIKKGPMELLRRFYEEESVQERCSSWLKTDIAKSWQSSWWWTMQLILMASRWKCRPATSVVWVNR